MSRFARWGLAWYAQLALLCPLLLPSLGQADTPPQVALWPTVPFVRGQDLCQYQDSYGRSRSQQTQDMSRLLGELIRNGADTQQSTQLLHTMDRLIDHGRRLATTGYGMDVLLEGSFKAALDRLYEEQHPKQRKLSFYNASALQERVRILREQQRQGYLPDVLIKGLTGIAWGTYSYSPNCQGDVVVTLHIETSSGQTLSYQARGLPQWVMGQIGAQVFAQFQKTHFPSQLQYKGKTLELLGSPGTPIGVTSSSRKAEYACTCMQGRLPTVGEYIFLSEMGDWNGGVNSAQGLWALSKARVMAPEMPRPSIVRSSDEFHDVKIQYFCVRQLDEKPLPNACAR